MGNKNKEFKDKFLQRFSSLTDFRKVFETINVGKEFNKLKFIKIGINTLVDSKWFSDQTRETYYFTEELGSIYASDIANAENKFLTKEIIKKTNKKENNLIVEKDLTENSLFEGINLLEKKGFTPDMIIINPYNSHSFWKMKQFRPERIKTRSDPEFFEGIIYGCKIISSFAVPRGITLILNSEELARILIKKDIKSDRDIEIFDKVTSEEIKNPKLKKIDLTSKHRILIYEILGVEVLNSEAVIILRHIADSEKKSSFD